MSNELNINDISLTANRQTLEAQGVILYVGNGHVIEDENGTPMPQQPVLQFENATVTNGDGKTIVSARGLPSGGSDGQVLYKDTSASEGGTWGDLPDSVLSVNGKTPDADGNVDIDASDIAYGDGNVQTELDAFNDTLSNKVNTTDIIDIAHGGTGKTTAADARGALGVPPTSHAVNANTYGLGTTGVYGHVKTVNGLTTSAHADGLALSAYQGKVLNDAIGGKAPTSHASTATTYGVGNASNYGHVKLSDTYTSSVGAAANSIGASQKAVYDAYNATAELRTVSYHTNGISLTNGTSEGLLIFKEANLVMLDLKFKRTSAINAWTAVHVATINSSVLNTYKPNGTRSLIGYINADSNTAQPYMGEIHTDGKIYIVTRDTGVPANQSIFMHVLYFR